MKNSIRLRKHTCRLAVWLLVAILVTAPMLGAVQFSQARMIIEVNASAGDAGVQIFLDGPGWSHIEVFDPDGERIFESTASGSTADNGGGTELFLETAEPSFDVQPLEDLLELFPAGMYTFAGTTVDGQSLSRRATLSHAIPAGPVVTAPLAGATVNAAAPVVIQWQAVTSPFPGTTIPVQIGGYQVIVERVKPQPLRVFSVHLGATATRVTVPVEFLQAKAEYNVEVLAIEAGGNQTISELSFKTQ